MTEQERKFAGVWIDSEIYLAADITPTEKLLIAEINSLDKGDGCFAGNDYFAEFFITTPGNISNMISRLKDKGLVLDVSTDDGRRLKISDDIKKILRKNKITEEPKQEESEISTDNLDVSTEHMESVKTIFNHWNKYQGKGLWKSHKKISNSIIFSVSDNIKDYSTEEICKAIDNYALVLLDNNYYWNYIWGLSTFLSRNIYPSQYEKKWLRFHPDVFISDDYLKIKNKSVVMPTYDVDSVNNLIKMFGRLINNRKFKPSTKQLIQFINADKKMKLFFEKRHAKKENHISILEDCLRSEYPDKGVFLYVGHLVSDHLWNVMMPQYMAELGE